MDIALLLAIPAVKKIIDAYRFIFDGESVQWRAFALTVGSWVLGTGLIALVAGSSLAADLGLADLGLADLILWGVALGSSAGVIADFVPVDNQLIQ
jgi:hypothetical protein